MSIKKKETITNTLISLFQTKDPQSIEQALLLLEEVDKDGSIHVAIIATSTIHIETDNLRHTAIIEGPLAQHCNHSITVYHPVYDRYIREQYTFPELFYRVLAQSPGGKSAELRNAITPS